MCLVRYFLKSYLNFRGPLSKVRLRGVKCLDEQINDVTKVKIFNSLIIKVMSKRYIVRKFNFHVNFIAERNSRIQFGNPSEYLEGIRYTTMMSWYKIILITENDCYLPFTAVLQGSPCVYKLQSDQYLQPFPLRKHITTRQ